MYINFGQNTVNCDIIFHPSQNIMAEGYKRNPDIPINTNYIMTNDSHWCNGETWNGNVYFPYGSNITAVNTESYSIFLNSFNGIVKIPDTVKNLYQAFRYCTIFNQPITIPNSVTETRGMFYQCNNFNQLITIPDSVINARSMFMYCDKFNQPVTIGNSVTDASFMFESCLNFNQPIIIPNNVTNTKGMFEGCSNFNQPIMIPNNVTDTVWMFAYCNNLSANIYCYSAKITNAADMFTSKNKSKRVNLFINSTVNHIFNKTDWNSIVSYNTAWTTMTNGFYNADYNIYVYTNLKV